MSTFHKINRPRTLVDGGTHEILQTAIAREIIEGIILNPAVKG
jgi:hypothetical protein